MAHETTVVTPERFQQGLSYEEFLAQAKVNLDLFARYYESAQDAISSDDIEFFKRAVQKEGGAARVLVLGAAYKKDVNDDRESPALEIMELLRARGVEVEYNDPYIPSLKKSRRHDLGLESVPLDEQRLRAADAVLVVTDHSDYDPEFIVRHARLVGDTRDLTGKVPEGRERIVKA